MIATVLVPPAMSITAAVALAAVLASYWIRLGREDVPAGRRIVRRLSLLVMLLSLPNFVRALSFLDPEVDRRAYVLAWSVGMVLLLIVILTALADVLVTMAVHRRESEREMREAGIALRDALEQARRSAPRGDGS